MGYVNVDTIYEEEDQEKQEVKNDYISIAELTIVEMVMKKSRFIAMTFHVESEDEVHEIVGNVRRSNKNAKHVAYAYILGENYSVAKNNDDGEPAGSAGAPIFEAMRAAHITNSLVIVVRYFGGIELGKSRLTRMYNSVSAGAINEAKKYRMVYCNEVEIKVPYANYGSVSKLFTDTNVHIIEQKNDESMPLIKIAVPVKSSEKIMDSIRARTRGAGIITKYGTGFYKFEFKGALTES